MITDQPHITYQLQMRKCGRRNCSKCKSKYGPGHGPYWYAFWHEGTGDKSRLRSRYIGKTQPPEALKSSNNPLSLEAIKANARLIVREEETRPKQQYLRLTDDVVVD